MCTQTGPPEQFHALVSHEMSVGLGITAQPRLLETCREARLTHSSTSRRPLGLHMTRPGTPKESTGSCSQFYPSDFVIPLFSTSIVGFPKVPVHLTTPRAAPAGNRKVVQFAGVPKLAPAEQWHVFQLPVSIRLWPLGQLFLGFLWGPLSVPYTISYRARRRIFYASTTRILTAGRPRRRRIACRDPGRFSRSDRKGRKPA